MSATIETPIDVAALAAALASRAGQAKPVAVTRLLGGRNNRAFAVTTEAGERLVLKLYHADARDRLGSEFAFLRCAWDRGLRNIPRPLACDRAGNAALYTLLPGARPRPDQVTAWHVEAALDFVLALNKTGDAPELGAAAEACFSVDEHLATIERRVARVETIVATDPVSEAATRFVLHRLRPVWAQAQAHLMDRLRTAGIAPRAALAPSHTCLSPSDFGFHNALVDDERIGFLDFEYAGRDDPAKLACDFFCQPEVPAPASLFAPFVARLVTGLHLDHADAERCRALRPAYRVKWACILLNEFLPRDAARREFAAEASVRDRRALQLQRADAQLAALATERE